MEDPTVSTGRSSSSEPCVCEFRSRHHRSPFFLSRKGSKVVDFPRAVRWQGADQNAKLVRFDRRQRVHTYVISQKLYSLSYFNPVTRVSGSTDGWTSNMWPRGRHWLHHQQSQTPAMAAQSTVRIEMMVVSRWRTKQLSNGQLLGRAGL